MSASSANLKAQGNVLFIAKNFAEAEKKYTGAIEASNETETADPKGLAVLYANRSACRLSLKRSVNRQMRDEASFYRL
jgi:stress-induced-phosphoprotein 1